MWNMLIRFGLIALLAAGAVWLVERPGTLTFDWLGYTTEISIMVALVGILFLLFLVILLWGLIRRVFHIPEALAGFLTRRKQENIHEALTKGIIAVGAGDASEASKYARKVSNIAGNDPLAQLLRAQAAQLRGDQGTVKRVFEAMVQAKDTEVLGLRGLFNQARQDGDMEKARALAERALELTPGLAWASKALLAFQSAGGEWAAVGQTLDSQRANGILTKDRENRLQAVVQTARAIELEETNPEEALSFAERALKAAPGLVPAAVVAGRILSAEQSIRKAARLLESTWKTSPHPDIAEVYAYLRAGDSPQDRQERTKTLIAKHDGGAEGAIALAVACIDAQDWKDARATLQQQVDDQPSVRVCELMAEIEQGEFGDKGRAREWLSRAVRAPRDPVWIADAHVSPVWLPVSPVTGELDVYEWKAPPSGPARVSEASPFQAVELDSAQETAPDLPILETPAEDPEMIEDVVEVATEPETSDDKPVDEAPASAANGAERAPAGSEQNEAQEDGPELHHPGDPGPRSPKDGKKAQGKAWYQTMFSR